MAEDTSVGWKIAAGLLAFLVPIGAVLLFGGSSEPTMNARSKSGSRRNPIPDSLTRNDVARVLADQPGNRNKDIDHLAEKWIASDDFKLTTVHVHLPDLGVTAGKTGQSQSTGPIIVDENIQSVARYEGSFGAAPRFLVLDGQNRVVATRKQGTCATIQAFVGDRVLRKLRQQDDEFQRTCDELLDATDDFLNTPEFPGGKLAVLKEYVRIGFLSQGDLDEIRKQWRDKYRA